MTIFKKNIKLFQRWKDSAALLEVNKDETMDSDCFVEAWYNQEIDQCTATQRERGQWAIYYTSPQSFMIW